MPTLGKAIGWDESSSDGLIAASPLIGYTPGVIEGKAHAAADEMQMIREYAGDFFCTDPEDIAVYKLAGDASTRRYFRLRLPDGTTFVVARYAEPFDPATHPYCDVTALFLAANLPVPDLFDVNGFLGMMLLQDLGDLRLQDWVPHATPDERLRVYRESVDLIIQIQEATPLAFERGSVAARLAFDEEKLGWELRFFYANFFEAYLQHPLPPEQKEEVLAECQEIARELAALPRVLTHRDFHSRNLMLCDGRQYIIDHQDARLGPVSYDLASLLGDPYVVLDENLVEEMFAYFIERKAARDRQWLHPSRWGEFRREYDLMTVQRLLKATGTYAYQTAVVGNSVYVPYIRRALEGALRALGRLDRFPALHRAVARVVEGLEGDGSSYTRGEG